MCTWREILTLEEYIHLSHNNIEVSGTNIQEFSEIGHQLAPLRRFLDDVNLTEIVINRPGEVRTEGRNGWTTYQVPECNLKWCINLAKLIANDSSQSIKEATPALSAALPTGERVQIMLAPAVTPGTVSFTIRKPSLVVISFEEFVKQGYFDNTIIQQSVLLTKEERSELEAGLPELDKELLHLLRNRNFLEFFKLGISEKKSTLLSGSTGAGKSTFANALMEFLPTEERILTAENAPEARLPADQNAVHLFYSKDGQGKSKLTPKQIFESTLWMRPDRVLPAELRGDEAYFFIQNVLNSGHPGTITTLHANSAKLAFLRLSLMIKTSPEGAGLLRSDILEMLYMLIDVVAQITKRGGKREISEIYYDPAFARKQMG